MNHMVMLSVWTRWRSTKPSAAVMSPSPSMRTFPALSAMRVCKSFKSVTILAACISVACSLVGILVAIVASTPVGSTIVVADLAVFAVLSVVGRICGGKKI